MYPPNNVYKSKSLMLPSVKQIQFGHQKRTSTAENSTGIEL